MQDEVKRYLKRREKRLRDRDFRKDDEEVNENNGGEKRGGHGNTRLPFGLCRKMGIKIGDGWTPRDAWDALAEKGVTPSEEYNRLKGGLKIKIGSTEWSNVYAKKRDGGGYNIYGDFYTTLLGGGRKRETDAKITGFKNRDEMISFLKSKGVKKFKDPDSGERINPMEIEAPEIVAEGSGERYKRMHLGYIYPYTSPTYKRYAIWGTDFKGKRRKLKEFKTEDQARKFAESLGCKPEDLEETRDYKKSKTTS